MRTRSRPSKRQTTDLDLDDSLPDLSSDEEINTSQRQPTAAVVEQQANDTVILLSDDDEEADVQIVNINVGEQTEPIDLTLSTDPGRRSKRRRPPRHRGKFSHPLIS